MLCPVRRSSPRAYKRALTAFSAACWQRKQETCGWLAAVSSAAAKSRVPCSNRRQALSKSPSTLKQCHTPLHDLPTHPGTLANRRPLVWRVDQKVHRHLWGRRRQDFESSGAHRLPVGSWQHHGQIHITGGARLVAGHRAEQNYPLGSSVAKRGRQSDRLAPAPAVGLRLTRSHACCPRIGIHGLFVSSPGAAPFAPIIQCQRATRSPHPAHPRRTGRRPPQTLPPRPNHGHPPTCRRFLAHQVYRCTLTHLSAPRLYVLPEDVYHLRQEG